MKFIIDVTRQPNTGIGNYSWKLLKLLTELDTKNKYLALVLPHLENFARTFTNHIIVLNNMPDSFDQIEKLSKKFDSSADVFIATNFSLPVFPEIPIIQVVHDPIMYLRHPEWQPTINDFYIRYGRKFVELLLNYVLPLAKNNLKSYHNNVSSSIIRETETIVDEIYQTIFSYYILRASSIITESKYVKQELKYAYPSLKHIQEVYLYIDSHLCYLNQDRKIIWPKDILNLLYVANIEPRKNHKLLFDTCYELFHTYKIKLDLTLLGKELYASHLQEFNKLRSLYKDEFKINRKFIKNREEMAKYYKNTDVFVFPSLEEGFAHPLLEAMDFQLPIVALKIAPTQEACQDAILYVDSNSAPEFAKKIIHMLESDIYEIKLKRKLKNRVRYLNKELSFHQFRKLIENTPNLKHSFI